MSPAWWPAALGGLAAAAWPTRSASGERLSRAAASSERDEGTSTDLAVVPRRAMGARRWRTGAREGTPTASDVADALVLLALALRSGLALVEALDEVLADSAGPVRDDLASVVAALRWGQPTAQAWRFAGPAWRRVARVWQVAEVTGGAPADVLAAAADRLREAQERHLERRAARAGVLLVLPLGLAFLPAFGLTALVPVVLALSRGLGLA